LLVGRYRDDSTGHAGRSRSIAIAIDGRRAAVTGAARRSVEAEIARLAAPVKS